MSIGVSMNAISIRGEPLDHLQGRRGVGPGVGHVDHEDQLGPDRAAALGDDLDDRVVVLLQAVVTVGPVDADLQLGGAIAQGLRFLDLVDERVAVILAGPPGRQERGIRGDAPRAVAQEFPYGHAERLGLDVPEGGVDRPQGTDERPAPPGHLRAAIEVFPDRFGLHRVGAQEHLLQPPAHAVGAAGPDTFPGDPGIGIRLADPDEALVGPHLHDQVVLRGGARRRVVVGSQEDVEVETGDLHLSRPGTASIDSDRAPDTAAGPPELQAVAGVDVDPVKGNARKPSTPRVSRRGPDHETIPVAGSRWSCVSTTRPSISSSANSASTSSKTRTSRSRTSAGSSWRRRGRARSRLLLARAVGEEQTSRIGNQTGGRVFLFLHTDDFWRDFHAYKARGVVFVRGPKEESFGTVAVFKDLYGNLWDLVQPSADSACVARCGTRHGGSLHHHRHPARELTRGRTEARRRKRMSVLDGDRTTESRDRASARGAMISSGDG